MNIQDIISAPRIDIVEDTATATEMAVMVKSLTTNVARMVDLFVQELEDGVDHTSNIT